MLADGESARGFAWSLESAILAGTVPPVLVVGVHNAAVTARSRSDLRAQEYLPGHNRRRFDAHLLEPGFRQATRRWAERLQRAGLPCRHEEWIGGHDNLWWERQFPIALGWLLAPS